VTERRWFSVLGPVRAWRGRTEIGLGSPQQKAVLAALLLRAGSQVPLHQLIDALWSDEPPASAAQVIRTYVYRLRRVLTAEGEPALIDSAGTGYVLHLPDGELDLAEFRQRMIAAGAARAVGDLSTAADELRHALALWKGEALAGLPGQYAEQQRTALAKLQLDALEGLLAIDVELGAVGPAIAELTQVVAEHPLDERFRRLLMLALYKSGQQAAAIAVYQEAQTLLADELGIDPGPRLQALYLRILRAEPEYGGPEGRAAAGPGTVAGRPGTAGAPGPIAGTPRATAGTPGTMPGATAGTSGTMPGTLGATAGAPGPMAGATRATAGTSGTMPGTPGAMAGAPRPMAGATRATAGTSGTMPGTTGTAAGRPGTTAGAAPGQMAGRPGTTAGAPGTMPGTTGAAAGTTPETGTVAGAPGAWTGAAAGPAGATAPGTGTTAAGTGATAAGTAVPAAGAAAVADGPGVVAGPVVAPAQLPADLPSFTGREAELARLDGLLPPDPGAFPPRMVISTVHGMAGTGKTSLAMHWAHRVAHRFPDGQVYLNLRGFDPAYPPMEPAEALRILFDAFGVAPQQIPVSLAAQTALYRSLLAGRRVLVLLDNARDTEQVRPLLPGTAGCLVIVTSRSQLSSLVALDQAQPLPLDVLPDAEARAFLTDRIGAARVAAEPAEVAVIVRRCGGLPLALTIVAARAVLNADAPLAAITAQLEADHGTLDAFSDGDSTLDVRAIFSWSYRGLSEPAARLFRLLPLAPGTSVTAAAAASLAGLPLRQTRGLAGELIRAHLLRELSPGRYVLHDLLRAYAAELTEQIDPASDRAAAVIRLVDHLLQTAHAAVVLHRPQFPLVPLDPPLPATVIELLPDEDAAAAWLTAEHQTMTEAMRLATDAGLDHVVWTMAATVADLIQRQGHWAEEIAMQQLALPAAERLGDLEAQARSHRWLGTAYARSGRADEAKASLLAALALFERLGDLPNQARTYRGLAFLSSSLQEPEEALRLALHALELCRQAGDETGIATGLNDSGWCYAMIGDYDNALRNCREALGLLQELADPLGEASTLDSLGYIHHAMGGDAEAADCYQRALDIFESLGDTVNCGEILTHLGECYRALGDLEAASAAWLRALETLEELSVPAAKQVRMLLEEIGTPIPDQLGWAGAAERSGRG
jgi:DNA-binding SARP family transcriptional activator/tetratricopeptide (TPR) repeat protein